MELSFLRLVYLKMKDAKHDEKRPQDDEGQMPWLRNRDVQNFGEIKLSSKCFLIIVKKVLQ